MALADVLADSTAFAARHDGEAITYLAEGELPGTGILAIVRRHDREADPWEGRSYRRARAEIIITNRASDGVVTVIEGKDQVLMPELAGGTTPETWRVAQVLDAGDGSWRLEVTL